MFLLQIKDLRSDKGTHMPHTLMFTKKLHSFVAPSLSSVLLLQTFPITTGGITEEVILQFELKMTK